MANRSMGVSLLLVETMITCLSVCFFFVDYLVCGMYFPWLDGGERQLSKI